MWMVAVSQLCLGCVSVKKKSVVCHQNVMRVFWDQRGSARESGHFNGGVRRTEGEEGGNRRGVAQTLPKSTAAITGRVHLNSNYPPPPHVHLLPLLRFFLIGCGGTFLVRLPDQSATERKDSRHLTG